MNTTPYWMSTAEMPAFPSITADLTVDVAVVGGGITGITTAYLLRKAGFSVALLERDSFAAAETGHTTAHLTYVTDLRLSRIVENFGRDHACACWDAGCAAIQQIQTITIDEKIACDFTWVPGYLHAPAGAVTAEERECLKNDAQLAAEFGFDCEYCEEIPFMRVPGVRFSNQAKFHPRRYLAKLLEVLPGEVSHVFQKSAVDEVLEDPIRLKVNGHTICCANVVFATHNPLQGVMGTLSAALFQTKLALYSTYAIGARLPWNSAPEAAFWDTADPYYYLRIDRRDDGEYAILGGADHKTGQAKNPAAHFAQVEAEMLRLFPSAMVDHRWSGQVIETADGLPFIGETAPHQFVATGFSGNGITFGTVAAMMISDAICGRRNPWQQLFDVHRTKISGTWDYLNENKDYPYYLIKDRLITPDPGSLKTLKPGQGRIVQLQGCKVAAYRDDHGELTLKSAVCPHMGCIVHWNNAERTWDCPCHGSRFTPSGEVIGGPAESPLEKAKV